MIDGLDRRLKGRCVETTDVHQEKILWNSKKEVNCLFIQEKFIKDQNNNGRR